MKDFKDNRRERSDKDLIKRLLHYMKPYKKEFFISVLLMLYLIAFQLLPPFLIGRMIDVISDPTLTNDSKISSVIIIVIIFFSGLLTSIIVNYFQTMILQKIGQKTVYDLRNEVFFHIENLSIGQINSVPVGRLVTRVTNDTNAIGEMFTSISVDLIKSIIFIFALLGALFSINVKMTLYILIIIPVVTVLTFVFRNHSRKAYRKVRSNVSEINAFLSENLSGMKVTQIFNQEDKKYNEFLDNNTKLKKSYLKEILIFGIYRPVIYALSILGTMIALYTGTIEVLAGAITAGVMFSFVMYVRDFFSPIQELAEQFNSLQSAFASAEKIFDVLDTKPDIIDLEDAIELEEFKGQIEFKNVWFQYIKDEWVLRDVSFNVKPGETIAFVGATGSGKTTILSLIVRNYEIQKGEILIDGINIKNIKRSSLRSHIGQMLQDVFLFTGTIQDNITLKDDEISLEEVKQASEYVGANTFIERLPDSYDHIVLERGNNFSAGQRQLISFARALVYKPSLMILDEATANIDSETEELIQESMKKMMNISTMLIVAHRLSTIQHADKIIVMQKGEIKEMGSHQELLNLRKIYYSLYQLQFEEKVSQ